MMTIESGAACIEVSEGSWFAIDGHHRGLRALGPRAQFDAMPDQVAKRGR
jgi:hypothetical protein